MLQNKTVRPEFNREEQFFLPSSNRRLSALCSRYELQLGEAFVFFCYAAKATATETT